MENAKVMRMEEYLNEKAQGSTNFISKLKNPNKVIEQFSDKITGYQYNPHCHGYGAHFSYQLKIESDKKSAGIYGVYGDCTDIGGEQHYRLFVVKDFFCEPDYVDDVRLERRSVEIAEDYYTLEWVKCLYENLPEEYKNDYAKTWNTSLKKQQEYVKEQINRYQKRLTRLKENKLPEINTKPEKE